jgi:ABC-2 type transport system permease protein
MNFIIFPFFFLSGALTPLESFPWVIRALSYADPLTYGVDGLRAALIGTSSFPMAVDLAAMTGFALVMLFLGTYFFEKSEGI